MFRSTLLTIILILAAACFNPAVAQLRTVQKYSKAPTAPSKKCSKNTKSSCMKIVVENFALDRVARSVSYGNGAINSASDTPIQTEPSAAGTQWIGKGWVEDPDGNYENPDYFYYAVCTVLEGDIDYSQAYLTRRMKNEKVTCNIDICVGVGHSELDVPDCVFLRGYTNFDIRVKTNAARARELSWYGAIIGGSGRFTGSTGVAEYLKGQNMDLGDAIELDASVSPYYGSEKVVVQPTPPLPPILITTP